MATPQGFDDEGNGVFKATLKVPGRGTITTQGETRQPNVFFPYKVNNEAGTIDLYQSTLTGDKLFYRYDPSTGRWAIPPGQENNYINAIRTIGEPGSANFDNLLSTAKTGANNVITATSSEAAKQRLFQTEGYKSLGNTGTGTGGAGGADTGTGTNEGTSTFTDENNQAIQNAIKNYKEGTRLTYNPSNLRYPENLSEGQQDIIKFSIVEYTPTRFQVSNNSTRNAAGKNILGTIVLPIPAGINEKNSVGWVDDEINPFLEGFSNVALTFLQDGSKKAGEVAKETADAMIGGPDGKKVASAIIASEALKKATGSANVLARAYGAIDNPNLELLFDTPTLRDFNFNFRFTPRSKEESVKVMQIIRTFKQAMSAKRSTSVLLLKTPHIFEIQYLTNGQPHPFLNKFKQCALTDMAVNYTPDGTYMTYSNSSMTSYEMALTFTELEPVFDDDHGNESPIANIGF